MIKTIDWIGLTRGREYVPFLLLFVFALPFKIAYSNIAILLFAIYLIVALTTKRLNYSFDRESFLAIKYLPALYGVFVITLLYTDDLSSGIRYLGSISFLLIIPLLLCFLRLSHREKSLIMTTFVSANLAAIIFNLARALIRSIQFTDSKIIFDASVAGGQPFWYSIVQGGNYFFYDEFSYFLHPTYWAIYLLFSVFALLNSLPGAQTKKRMFFSVCLVVLCIVSIFLCSSRIIILSTAGLLSFYFVLVVIRKRKIRWIMAGVVLLLVLVTTVAKNPRFVGFENFTTLESFHHMRLEAWRSSFLIFKENPILGVGIGDAKNELTQRHLARGFQEGFQNKYNEHNQYLHLANAAGLLGLGVFLLALGSGALNSFQHRNYLQFAFICSFALVCLVENVLVRRAGIVYFSFFYALLFTGNKDIKPGLNTMRKNTST